MGKKILLNNHNLDPAYLHLLLLDLLLFYLNRYHIQDNNLKLKLFFHSKSFQEILNIKYIDYKEEYFKKIRLNLNKYLLYDDKENDKEALNNNLQRFLNKKKLNKDNIINLVYDIYSNKKVEGLEEEDVGTFNVNYGYLIDIFSPFFNVMSKTEFFEKRYCIPIIEDFIEKNKLNNDYKNIFEKLNKSNIKYASILLKFNDNNKINYLKDFNIDFNRIKRLVLIQNDIINKNDKFLLDTLFSFKNIENNMVYLKIDLKWFYKERTNSDSFENVNNFKSLKYLYISSFDFDKIFVLKLANLKLLSIEKCRNICLSEDCYSNIKKLRLYDAQLILNADNYYKTEAKEKNSLSKKIMLPKLEACEFYKYDIISNSIIDLKNLIGLKYFMGNDYDFVDLKSESLTDVKIFPYLKAMGTFILTKILGLKKIKNLYFSLFKMSDHNISTIQGENESLTNLSIIWDNNEDNCILISLQKKFPNLSTIKILTPKQQEEDLSKFWNVKPTININENENCKINNIFLNIRKPNTNLIQFDCCPFERLIEVRLYFQPKIYNLEYAFPLLGSNCQTIFRSLKVFHFQYEYLSIFENIQNILENIYNNFEKMPNLNEFLLNCTCDISEEFYMKFLIKILSSNLNFINFDMRNNEKYNKSELRESDLEKIYPNYDMNQYKYIYISELIGKKFINLKNN